MCEEKGSKDPPRAWESCDGRLLRRMTDAVFLPDLIGTQAGVLGSRNDNQKRIRKWTVSSSRHLHARISRWSGQSEVKFAALRLEGSSWAAGRQPIFAS